MKGYDREHAEPHELERDPASFSPDTEIGAPLTPVPSTESVDVVVTPQRPVESALNPTLTSHAATPHTDTEDLTSTTKGTFSPHSRRATAAQVREGKVGEGSSTTLQSMMRPEITMKGTSHTRRFLSIERELEQCGATIRLLEKEQIQLRRDTRIAWGVAGLALVAAIAAWTL